MFEKELQGTARPEQRNLNELIDKHKWIVAYPAKTNDSDEFCDLVLYAFTNAEPVYIPAGYENQVIDLVVDYKYTFYQEYTSIAPHLHGTIWFDAKTFKKAYIPALPFDLLDNAPEISVSPNDTLLEAVLGFMGLGGEHDYTYIDSHLTKYLLSLPVDVLRISDVYCDIDKSKKIKTGQISSVIRYHGDIIGYILQHGYDLMGVDYFTADMKKFQNFLKDMVDKSGSYDMMHFSRVMNVSGQDADIFLPVPGFTQKIYEDD